MQLFISEIMETLSNQIEKPDQHMTTQSKTCSTTPRLRAACERCRQKKIRCSGPSGPSGRGQCDDCCKADEKCDFKHRIVVHKHKKRVDARIRELEQKIGRLATQLQESTPEQPDLLDTKLASLDVSEQQFDDRQSNEKLQKPSSDALTCELKTPCALKDISTTKSACTAPITTQFVSGSKARSREKSRTGCLICKKRKLKCDEKKPDCDRCINRGYICVYDSSPATIAAYKRSNQSIDRPLDEIHTAMLRHLTNLDSIPSTANLIAKRDCFQMLGHFENRSLLTFGAPHLQHAMYNNVLSLASGSPFLLHAIYAFGALHIHKIQGTADTKLGLFASSHFQNGLKLYSEELCKPLKIQNINVIFAACMLLALIAYSSTDFNSVRPSTSFINSTSPDALSWLVSQQGFQALRSTPSVVPHLPTSVFSSLFRESHIQGLLLHKQAGLDNVPCVWRIICNINATSTNANNPYYAALRVYLMIEDIDPTISDNFSFFISFPGRMRPEYIELIRVKDPVALLILSHWLAKMCEMNQWWSARRVKSECWAICEYLDTMQSVDEHMRALLARPIQACGYVRGQDWPEEL